MEPRAGSARTRELPAFSLPAGFTDDGVPVGIELLGKPFAEPDLIAIAYAYEQTAMPRRPPQRTPSLASDTLSVDFRVTTELVRGKLRLDRPTQTLHYELELRGILDSELIDVKLHLGAPGENGAIVALLGTKRRGTVPIRNQDLPALMESATYLALYTTAEPTGAARAQIERIR